MRPTGPATAEILTPQGNPITVIGTERIRETFDTQTLNQARNARDAPGVTDFVLNPDAHIGYGAPIGSVLVSPTHIYPGPVGVDIKCSMSLLQLDLPTAQMADRKTRRAVIRAITERIPTGPGKGQRSVARSRRFATRVGRKAVVEGASEAVCRELGVPPHWARRCEDAAHGSVDELAERFELITGPRTPNKLAQLGSYGGGNHFGECEAVETKESLFGLKDGHIAFLSHCGSRGFGHDLAVHQFRVLNEALARRGIEPPAGDRHLVYAELGTEQADNYLHDMSLGANFATVNHLLINALVLEAFQEVLPGVEGELVYFISHNIARLEQDNWVHRKGATRAFPAGHPGLAGTPFESTGHPILLPGNPRDGSVVMVAEAGADKSAYSVNHGAGRVMGRKAAKRALDQRRVDDELERHDILTNCRRYPLDEAPDAYKDFGEVVKSVERAGLARVVAHLGAKFVIKDGAPADD